jgi:hypothetical protein
MLIKYCTLKNSSLNPTVNKITLYTKVKLKEFPETCHYQTWVITTATKKCRNFSHQREINKKREINQSSAFIYKMMNEHYK